MEISNRALLAKMAGMHFDGKRDLYQTFGYPRELTTQDYIEQYKRGGIAGRLVDAFPGATWREPPAMVSRNEALVQRWDDFANFFDLYGVLTRLDRLASLGHYGVLLIGVDGGDPLDQPVQRLGGRRVIYLQPHGEATADIARWNSDPTSSRFGKPELYHLTTGVDWSGVGAGQKRYMVHHSRVVHVAEGALEDVSIGRPRLQRVFNYLMDLEKLSGAGAEVYWQNVAQMMALIADADVQMATEDRAEVQKQIEEMQHGLRRFLRLQGFDVKNLASSMQGSDASNHMERLLDLIAGSEGIPKRILIGSERGELSSEQDENNWAARIAERREQFATPQILVPLVDRLMAMGVLPEEDDYTFEWPEADNLGESERSNIALTRAQAVRDYMNTPGAELIVTPDEFRGFMGLKPLEELPSFDMPTEDPLDEEDEAVTDFFQQHKRAAE